MGSIEVAAVGAEAQFGRVTAAGLRPDLDYAGHGVGSVKSALRPADKFQTLRLLQRHDSKIECSARVVYGNTVNDDLVVT